MNDPYRRLIEDRIAELEMFQRWYDQHRHLSFHVLEGEHRVELFALVRIRDEARRIEAARPDPIDDWKRSAGPVDYIETL